MITRIVKLSFENSYCVEFEAIFFEIQKIVLSNEGCNSVELLKSYEPGLYFTYSVWDNEASLNNYRNSPVFKKIWRSFKPNFNDGSNYSFSTYSSCFNW